MKKVLFVVGELDFADQIAVAYLSAIARNVKTGQWTTFFCDLKVDNLQALVENIKPDVVAYSSNIATHGLICTQNRSARVKHDYVSILGGPTATIMPETYEDSGMDVYCR